MYEIPSNFDLSPIHGENVWTVRFGRYSFWIQTDTMWLRGDQGYTLFFPDGAEESCDFAEPFVGRTGLPILVGRVLDVVEASDGPALLLRFSGGLILSVPADSENYECIEINLDKPDRFGYSSEDPFVMQRTKTELQIVF